MKNKVVFIVENAYQQFYAEILSYFLIKKKYGITIYSYGTKSELLFLSSEEVNIEYYKTIDGNSLQSFSQRKKLGNIFVDKIIEEEFTTLFVFKDHAFLQSLIIKGLKKNKTKSILIEEGLSLYTIKGNGFIKSAGLKRFIKYRIRQVYYMLFGAGIVKEEFGCNNNLSLVLAFDSELVPKSKIITRIDRLPTRIPQLKLVNQKDFPKLDKNRNILILISPFLFLSRRTKEHHIQKIQMMIDIINSLEYNAILKVHPLENIDDYSNLVGSFEFINYTSMPIEAIHSIIKPLAVISEGSSASINFSRFYNTKSIVLLSDFLLDGFFKDTQAAINVLNKYCEVAYSEDEMLLILKKLLAKNSNDCDSEIDNLEKEYNALINKIFI